MDFFRSYRKEIEAVLIFCLLMLLTYLTIPPYKQDPNKAQLINTKTKEIVYENSPNEIFFLAILCAFAFSILWTIFREEKDKIGRRRSIVEVWDDIPDHEKIKLGLPSTLDKSFIADNALIPIDETYSLLRFPRYQTDSFLYMVLDMLDDWKKRSYTPLYSFYEGNMGLQSAKTLLGKKTQPMSRFLQQAQQLGLSEREIRMKMMEKIIQEEEKAQKVQIGDEIG